MADKPNKDENKDKDKKSNKKERPPRRRKKVIKWQTLIIIVGIIISVLISAYAAYLDSKPIDATLSYNEFWAKVEDGNIESVRIIQSKKYLDVTTVNGEKFIVNNPGYDEFQKDLLENNIDIEIQKITVFEAMKDIILAIPAMALVFIIAWYFMSALGSQSTTLYRIYKPEDIVTFDQVAGMSETKAEVQFAVSQLKNHKKLQELGTRPCKGIILEGPPGTGKTLLAKAIAGEANVPFISTNGADFIEMFVGLGAARVRNLWELAELNAPCVVFIDEIDAVGRRRSGGSDGASTEANQTLNELLSKMDGLGKNAGIFVVGATNRIEDLDPALIRPGRFDKRLFVGPPKTKKDRDEIVSLYMKNKKFEEGVTLDKVSKLLFGLSGAEIEQVLNESVLISVQQDRNGVVSLQDVDSATMKLRTYGVATSHSSKDDIQITSVHEAGHAVMNQLLGRKVSKVSITPYNSGVGGVTIRDTDDIEDRKMVTHKELIGDIKVLLAGRAAEKIIFGDTSAGCSNDIERATMLAYKMYYNFAMDDSFLINPDTLKDHNLAILNSNDTIIKVNNIVSKINNEVMEDLGKYKEEIQSLADRLSDEENVFDYTLNKHS